MTSRKARRIRPWSTTSTSRASAPGLDQLSPPGLNRSACCGPVISAGASRIQMPLRRGRAKARPPSDPLTACLDANGTYICTSFNPRCFIIQKVTAPSQATNDLGPEEHKEEEDQQPSTHQQRASQSSSEGYTFTPLYMNGHVSQPPAPRVLFNSRLHEIGGPELDTLLSGQVESVEGEQKFKDEPLQTTPLSGGPNHTTREYIKKTLTKQLSFYFSSHNLANDEYLVSQMDRENFVPIWTVANFNLIKKLTNDIELITEALEECSNVQLNESRTKVRPLHQRRVVILREVPPDTTVDDLTEFLLNSGLPAFSTCEYAGNNAWYVTYATDEEAQTAFNFFGYHGRVFRGVLVHARIKATLIRPQMSEPIRPKGPYNGEFSHPQNAAFDPMHPQNQQRVVYNGAPHAQIPVPHNQFYYQPYAQSTLIPCMPAGWQNNYYSPADIGTVFHLNGLAPQAPNKTPFKNAPKSKKKANCQMDQAAVSSNMHRMQQNNISAPHRNGMNPRGIPMNEIPEAGMAMNVQYVPHSVPLVDMSMGYSYVPQTLSTMRNRKKKSNDENTAGPSHSQEVEQRVFDLGDSAFPPLKANSRRMNNSSDNQQDSSADQPSENAMPWSDHRIVDILKGNAASKSSSTSTSSKGSLCANDNESPRAGSPKNNDHREAPAELETAFNSALTLRTPEKTPETKCTMTDKATKTDDVLLNGETDVCPTTTNAATMTTGAESSHSRSEVPKPTSSNTPPRMSYAQVAQHPKEAGSQKDKKETSTDGETPAAPVQNDEKKGKDSHRQDKSDRHRHDSRGQGSSNGVSRKQRRGNNSRKNNS